MRGPGEKWTEYYPASYTDTIVLVREPRLLVLEKAYANAAFDGLASLVVVWTRLGTGCFTTVVLNDRNSKIAVHYLRHSRFSMGRGRGWLTENCGTGIGAARFFNGNRMLGRWQRRNRDVRNHYYNHRSSSSLEVANSLASTTRALLLAIW
jgi:hypothetical protein